MGYVPPKLIKVPDGCTKVERAEIGMMYLSGFKGCVRSKKLTHRADDVTAKLQVVISKGRELVLKMGLLMRRSMCQHPKIFCNLFLL